MVSGEREPRHKNYKAPHATVGIDRPGGTEMTIFRQLISSVDCDQGSERCCFHLESGAGDRWFKSYGSAKAMHTRSRPGGLERNFHEISSRLQSDQGSEICCFHLESGAGDSPFKSYGSAKAMHTRSRPGGERGAIFMKFLQDCKVIRGPKYVVSTWNQVQATPRSRVMGPQRRCRPALALGVRRERSTRKNKMT
jgi:hypothetical protein